MYKLVDEVFSQYPLNNAQMACEETYTTLQKNIFENISIWGVHNMHNHANVR